MRNVKRFFTLVLVLVFLFQSLITTRALSDTGDNLVAESAMSGPEPEPEIILFSLTITDSSVELVWTSEDNSVEAASYDIYRDDEMIISITSFTYIDTGLSPETNYTYYIKARDLDGKEFADSNRLSVATKQASETSGSELPSDPAAIDITETSDTLAWDIVTTTPNPVKYTDEDILRSTDPDFETDRYIIKYKYDTGRENSKTALEAKGLKNQKISKNDNMCIDIISFDQKRKAGDLIKELRDYKLDSDIEYIQPDYQLTLLSNDPLFGTQWGLQNTEQEDVNPGGGLFMRQRTDMLPPRLRVAIERSPELKEFMGNTPVEELRHLLMEGDVPGDIPPEMLMELAHDPLFMDMGDNTGVNMPEHAVYICDAGVVDAWEFSLGEGAVVAVIDTGIDITHEDLAENIWINAGEIPGNGIDDDQNGYIDDVNGWNFFDESNQVFDPVNTDNERHGTQVAGIISAVKDNGKGIAGVSPSAKVLPLKVFVNGRAYTSDIIDAIQYAENSGAKIVNCSWGGTADNPALEEAMSNADLLFVCAAGNSGTDIDMSHIYPASFELPNIITVASINKNGILSGFSNYGVINVDVAAPGEDIKTTLPGNAYGDSDGTSMAAAFVSGEASLLYDIFQDASVAEIKDRICMCSDHLSSLSEKISNSAEINCTSAIKNIISDEIIMISDTVETYRSVPAMEGSGEFELLSVPPVEGQFTAVANGGYHSLVLKNDGTVWAWGHNNYGQLGDGATTGRTTPVQVSSLSGITDIAGGLYHSLALKNDGTVWAWGHNSYGQLGDGTTTHRSTAVQVSGLSGITAIAGGGYHSLALKNDGTVWAWGQNSYGQLGDGTTTRQATAVQVSGLSGITAIAGGGYHSLALKNDGTVWAWGYNNFGELGDGSTAYYRTTAVQVSGLSGIIAIAGGSHHSLALKNDRTVWAWGDNYCGQLGDGTTIGRNTAVQVSGLSGVSAIERGSYYSLALKDDGTVWAWGSNCYGQLGDGTTMDRKTAVQVSGLSGITAVTGWHYHSLALKSDGTVWSWGDNTYGQLGDGTSTHHRTTAVYVSGLGGIMAIAGGYYHSLALKNDGMVWAWGCNCYGQLGDGTTTHHATAVQTSGLSGITAIAGKGYHSLALKNNGTVWAWGDNFFGQLGDGTTTERTTAVQVSGLSGITAIAGGLYHSLALKNNGTVWAWGDNCDGQLGDGTTIERTTAVRVSGLSGITAIAGGCYHSLALKNNGTVWAWGDNCDGQLGDGTTIGRNTAVQVSGLSGITAIAGGFSHSLALKNDGTVWAWGNNSYGQLGDGTTTERTLAVQVSGLSGITAIAGGSCHSLALKSDGTVWAWGDNSYGQLGDGTTTHRTTAVQVSGLSGITAIAGGDYHSLALKNDGTVWAWGWNYYGQLGNGEKGYSDVPKWVAGTHGSISDPPDYIYNTYLVLKVQNIDSFTGHTFSIEYDPVEIEDITDLCAMTHAKELETGTIEGTDITIIQNSPGTIKFTVNKAIEQGKTWSGVVNIISFTSSDPKISAFTCTIE